MKISVKDLACYRKLTEEQRQYARIGTDTCFIIPDTFSDSIKTLLYDYIIHRGEVLALGSMRSEYWAFNRLCEFFLDKYSNLGDLTQIPQQEMERSLRVWMIKKGYATASIHNRLNQETPELRKSPLIHFLNRLYRFGLRKEENTEMEKDVWEIDKLPFCVRNNPTQSIRRINFQGIFQEKIRSETKTAVSITIRYLALTTILQQIRAMNRLSSFLKESFPDVASSRMLNREIIEQYLIFLNTEETGKKCFRSELSSLKSLLDTIALSLDEPSLKTLFLPGDISERGRISGYRAYTDSEVKTWNDAMKKLPSQVARVMVIHQLLGNRISETLTLKQDCLCIRGGNLKVKVFQVKTQRTIYKPANDMVKKLIEKAIEETNETYGKREYVFVSSRNPDSPMTYETVQYHLMKLILQENLTDEHGKRYGVGTHAFRHTMGRKLTQMHVDDKTIAMLLGHSGISSVNRYRKFGSRALANETKDVRGSKDRILKQVMRGWEENEV